MGNWGRARPHSSSWVP